MSWWDCGYSPISIYNILRDRESKRDHMWVLPSYSSISNSIGNKKGFHFWYQVYHSSSCFRNTEHTFSCNITSLIPYNGNIGKGTSYTPQKPGNQYTNDQQSGNHPSVPYKIYSYVFLHCIHTCKCIYKLTQSGKLTYFYICPSVFYENSS